METTCGSLLTELQKIWNEIGEPEAERDRMILELEQECLQLYRRKVDQTSKHRAQLRKAVADAESELAFICAALGEPPMHIKQTAGSLKVQLQTVSSLLDEMQRKKKDRKSMFIEVVEQINHIIKELHASDEANKSLIVIDDSDLSLKKLEDLKIQLHDLEKEKSKRLKQVFDHLSTLSSLCLVLGLDFKLTVSEIHPTLDDSHGSRSISSHTIEKLFIAIQKLNDFKLQRLEKLQNLAATMVELWCLMDTPVEEQLRFQNVTRKIAASGNEIFEPKSLSLDFIKYAEAEVSRLQEMKSSKIKEVLLKKRMQLEQLCREAHMVVDAHKSIDYSVETIESGAIDPSYLLEQIEVQISKVKEEAYSRKELLEKIEKWLAACEEESWLEEYNRDDNRYNAGKGAHLMLKRAERARALVNKIPAMVELLTSKARAWEKQRGVEFLYDGVGLLYMLDQYRILQQEKEQERQRERDQKKLHGQMMVEKEALFGSKPSPSNSGRKTAGSSTVGANSKRFSVGGAMLQNAHAEKAMFSSHAYNKSDSLKQPNMRNIQQSRSAVLSSGKRNTPGLPSKKPSNIGSNPKSTEPKLIRKPLSPLSSFSCQVNNANLLPYDRYERKENQDVISKAGLPVTPSKVISAFGGSETTPKKMPIPMPSTPPTVSVTMQMAMTPATPYIPSGNRGMECSFEERRAGFIAF
ncbi:OLC1v1002317C1 [Oldenlandia corymbosa var. corymbosa]|uniref:OLC1v1002317C1 n=1 Tax=Oldenlandia corymbosa var. corymbosa TaxID=529605 RepID=A0AAV1D7D8_OLDCO|nr:OLC1v1002317C1 [Oldenlandia corymbosa var. corymbosa]